MISPTIEEPMEIEMKPGVIYIYICIYIYKFIRTHTHICI